MSNDSIAPATRTGPAPVAVVNPLPAASLPGSGRQAPEPHIIGTGSSGGTGADVLHGAASQVVAALPGDNSFAFQFDKQTGMTIVKVYNKATGELVRQIPTEEIVRIAQILRQEEHQPVLDVKA
jgi:flagellar protein FlaG